MGLLVGGLEPWIFEWLSRNSWEFHHPNWRTPSPFFRGIETTNQIRIHTNCAWDNAGTFCWFLLDYDYYLEYGRIVAWGWPVSTLPAPGDPRSVKLPRLLFREKCQIEWFQKYTGWICWISSKSTILATSFPVPQMVFACFRYHANGSLDSFGSARDMVVRMETTDRELQVLHVRIYVPSGLSAYYTMIIIIYIYNYILYIYIYIFLIDIIICVLYTFKMIITDERRRMNCSNFGRRLELLEWWLD